VDVVWVWFFFLLSGVRFLGDSVLIFGVVFVGCLFCLWLWVGFLSCLWFIALGPVSFRVSSLRWCFLDFVCVGFGFWVCASGVFVIIVGMFQSPVCGVLCWGWRVWHFCVASGGRVAAPVTVDVVFVFFGFVYDILGFGCVFFWVLVVSEFVVLFFSIYYLCLWCCTLFVLDSHGTPLRILICECCLFLDVVCLVFAVCGHCFRVISFWRVCMWGVVVASCLAFLCVIG